MDTPRTSSSLIMRRPDAELRPMAWAEICDHSELQGNWVALDDCAYDAEGRAKEGAVVDYDTNLADLCARLRADQRSQCAVMFCPERAA